jgi:hypothetical protein
MRVSRRPTSCSATCACRARIRRVRHADRRRPCSAPEDRVADLHLALEQRLHRTDRRIDRDVVFAVAGRGQRFAAGHRGLQRLDVVQLLPCRRAVDRQDALALEFHPFPSDAAAMLRVADPHGLRTAASAPGAERLRKLVERREVVHRQQASADGQIARMPPARGSKPS